MQARGECQLFANAHKIKKLSFYISLFCYNHNSSHFYSYFYSSFFLVCFLYGSTYFSILLRPEIISAAIYDYNFRLIGLFFPS